MSRTSDLVKAFPWGLFSANDKPQGRGALAASRWRRMFDLNYPTYIKVGILSGSPRIRLQDQHQGQASADGDHDLV